MSKSIKRDGNMVIGTALSFRVLSRPGDPQMAMDGASPMFNSIHLRTTPFYDGEGRLRGVDGEKRGKGRVASPEEEGRGEDGTGMGKGSEGSE